MALDPKVESALSYVLICGVVLAAIQIVGLKLRLRIRTVFCTGLVAGGWIVCTAMLKGYGTGGFSGHFGRGGDVVAPVLMGFLFSVVALAIASGGILVRRAKRSRKKAAPHKRTQNEQRASSRTTILWIASLLTLCILYSVTVLWLLPHHFPTLDPQGAREVAARKARQGM